jgi:protein gp37
MNKTKIEWLKSADGKPGYTINPVKGLCPMACPYCYARRLYKRFHWDETIRFEGEVLEELQRIKKPSRIFVGSTIELFGSWVKEDWLKMIFEYCGYLSRHTFIFLTKRPENLLSWSPFPANCWVGCSVTDWRSFHKAAEYLYHVQAGKLFFSIEPLLDRIEVIHNGISTLSPVFDAGWLDWLIIGQQTPVSAKSAPKEEWIEEIVNAADQAKIPVFLKQNLWNNPLVYEGEKGIFFTEEGKLRQEFPKVDRV